MPESPVQLDMYAELGDEDVEVLGAVCDPTPLPLALGKAVPAT